MFSESVKTPFDRRRTVSTVLLILYHIARVFKRLYVNASFFRQIPGAQLPKIVIKTRKLQNERSAVKPLSSDIVFSVSLQPAACAGDVTRQDFFTIRWDAGAAQSRWRKTRLAGRSTGGNVRIWKRYNCSGRERQIPLC